MNKGALIVLVIFVVACLGYVIFGMSEGADGQGDAASAGEQASGQAGAQGEAASDGDKAAPVVKRDDDTPDKQEEETANLVVPASGDLPSLKLPKAIENALPTKPHGKLQVEGKLEEVTAEMAIRSVFPKIRGCYAELRTRAPQARGRMLMRFRVSNGGEGKAGTGELYLKETQCTDPKYLTCIRDAIDKTKFKVDKADVDGTVEFPMFLMPEDADSHDKAMAEARAAGPAAAAE